MWYNSWLFLPNTKHKNIKYWVEDFSFFLLLGRIFPPSYLQPEFQKYWDVFKFELNEKTFKSHEPIFYSQ